ncbi:DUF2065 domain-containing protein [Methylotenera sp.]|uniref:DUF2065 domain-containing protein n=1 Tax=Methylotenera sp. TaxID=2051956 RepID=UPI0027172B65|nr:DUF2065 domain-containing protein [Methylotenera sp.]MDO9204312.1 DUF2065 domain-containing protein [Methylotenera sp.]MDO9392935.1 DUF2065 domain-containing protein [Methylotenera sp.]MDP1522504.1 DUF2065 domain-containing protein [Methylotenera sp.]MDP2071381.1 DUF2065 domain-containing protein [Methylotenera sp.]MDP2229846.1 DUF2065 domain-containing protein [Methylotenera sp.]
MNSTLITALGLMLVLEGLLPLLLPQAWRETFKRMVALKDGQLRSVGLLSVVGGLVLIWLSR